MRSACVQEVGAECTGFMPVHAECITVVASRPEISRQYCCRVCMKQIPDNCSDLLEDSSDPRTVDGVLCACDKVHRIQADRVIAI